MKMTVVCGEPSGGRGVFAAGGAEIIPADRLPRHVGEGAEPPRASQHAYE